MLNLIIKCSTPRPQTFTRLRVLRLTGKELILKFIAYILVVRHFSPYVNLASLSGSKCSQAFPIFRCSCGDQEQKQWRPENKATHNPLARINTSPYKFVGCCLATEFLNSNNTVEWVEVIMEWQWVAWGNMQQIISYIPQMEQHSPFRLMLLCLENTTTIYKN